MQGTELADLAAEWLALLMLSPQLLAMAEFPESSDRFRAFFELLALLYTVGAVRATRSDKHNVGIFDLRILDRRKYDEIIREHLTDMIQRYMAARPKKKQKTGKTAKKSKNTDPMDVFGKIFASLGFRPTGASLKEHTGWIQNAEHEIWLPLPTDGLDKSVFDKTKEDLKETLVAKARALMVADPEDAGSASDKTPLEFNFDRDAYERAKDYYTTSLDKTQFTESRFAAIHSDAFHQKKGMSVPERKFNLWGNGTPEDERLYSYCPFCKNKHFIGEPALHFKAITSSRYVNTGLDCWKRADTAKWCKLHGCVRQ